MVVVGSSDLGVCLTGVLYYTLTKCTVCTAFRLPTYRHVGRCTTLLKWDAVRSSRPGFIHLRAGACLGTAHFSAAVNRTVHLTGTEEPPGDYYSPDSDRLGAFNKLLGLSFGSHWTINQLDCVAACMFQVDYDSRLPVIAASRWSFAHMLPPGCSPECISVSLFAFQRSSRRCRRCVRG